MLYIYTTPVEKPARCIDLSTISLNELATNARTLLTHQMSPDTRIWLGYLEGWMLTPQEETILRGLIRKFPCSVICSQPLALSYAWKNEIHSIYTSPVHHGDTHTNNNGSSVHDGCSFGHEHPRGATAH